MGNNINEIKRLHDLGLSILYLHKKTKRPVEKAWTTIPNKTWPEMKKAYEPGYNIGVRLGSWSKIEGRGYLACIDVDIKDPEYRKEAIKKLREVTNGETYPEVRSGSGNGSRHLYCVTKKPFKQITLAKVKDCYEICIYSTGRQMVAPPSIHPVTGEAYVWRVPLTIEALPTFDPESVQPEDREDVREIETALDFEAVDVDLSKHGLPKNTIALIEEGKGCDDRSAGLFLAAIDMCRHDFTDNEILSVLSNRDYWLGEAAYEHTQSNSRKRAVNWLYKYTLIKARHESTAEAIFDKMAVVELQDGDEETVEAQAAEITEAHSVRIPDVDGNGKPKNTMKNVRWVIEQKVGKDAVRFDEFANRVHFNIDTPYGGKAGRELTDADDLNLKAWVADHFRFEPSRDTCYEAHTVIGRKNAYHPVREWLDGLRWDGKSRLDQWLTRGLGAHGDADYLAAIGRKTLVAAVNRIYEPGCKFDYVMILEGGQGIGKSTALAILAGRKWFTDSIGKLDEKDVVDQMCGKWIIELGELAAVKKADAEVLKSFVSRTTDRVRMAYGRRSQDYDRQSIFIGTTNKDAYFQDETGNRRFWPVHVEKADLEWLAKNRDQLFAEAVELYRLGESLYLDEFEEIVAREVQASKFITDELEPVIARYLDDNELSKFTTTDIFQGVNGSVDVPNYQEAARIGKILTRLGCTRKTIRKEGVAVKGWGYPKKGG